MNNRHRILIDSYRFSITRIAFGAEFHGDIAMADHEEQRQRRLAALKKQIDDVKDSVVETQDRWRKGSRAAAFHALAESSQSKASQAAIPNPKSSPSGTPARTAGVSPVGGKVSVANPQDADALVSAARARIADFDQRAAKLSELTTRKYLQAAKRMGYTAENRFAGRDPDPFAAHRTFWHERASSRFALEFAVSEALKRKDTEQLLAAYGRLTAFESRYPKGEHQAPVKPPRGQKTAIQLERDRAKAEGRNPAVKRQKKRGAKHAGQVGIDFENRMMARATAFESSYAAPVAIGLLTGARPIEIQRGVEVRMGSMADGSPAVEMVIQCAKKQGVKDPGVRTIRVPAHQDDAARHLAWLVKDGRPFTVNIRSTDGYSQFVNRCAIAALGPAEGGKITGYSLRHVVAADAKARVSAAIHSAPDEATAEAIGAEGAQYIAQLQGHHSEASQSMYGAATAGRGGRRVEVQSTREITRKRPRRAVVRQLSALQEKALQRVKSRTGPER